MKLFKKHGLKLIGVFLALIVIFALTPWGKASFKTLLILPEFIPNSPIKTVNLFSQKPQNQEVQFPSGERTIYADLWLPKGKGKYPGAVLHLGVDIDRKDERAQKLANALSRSGIAILVPNIPSLERRRVLAEGKDDLVASFEYLKSRPEVKSDKVGYVGFCASGGLVMVAAEDPKIADQVKFIAAINPYYDLLSLYKNLTLRQIEDDGQILSWTPNFKTVEIYNRETIGLLENKREREVLNNYLTLIDKERLEGGNFEALNPKEANSLSQEAKFTHELLTNNDPIKVSFYQENTTVAQKNFVRELSPKTEIDKLKAKTFILMDKNNIYIPFTEAESLHQALGGKDHLFVETKILPEGNLVRSLSPKDYLFEGLKIFRFVYRVLLEVS